MICISISIFPRFLSLTNNLSRQYIVTCNAIYKQCSSTCFKCRYTHVPATLWPSIFTQKKLNTIYSGCVQSTTIGRQNLQCTTSKFFFIIGMPKVPMFADKIYHRQTFLEMNKSSVRDGNLFNFRTSKNCQVLHMH